MKNLLSQKFICSCKQIKNKEYRDEILNNKSKSFEEINTSLGVAVTCGACLLNAELVYINSSRQNNNKSSNYNFSNKFKLKSYKPNFKEYSKRKIIKQTGPILSGANITTDLVISNISPDGFEKFTVPYKISLIIKNNFGENIYSKHFELQPNKRIVCPLNIKNNKSNKITAEGSFRLKITPLSKGYIGLTRPHIRISSKNSISSIHLQHARRKGTSFDTSFINKDESQYLSLVNLENKNVDLNICIDAADKTIKQKNINIKPLESICVSLSDILGKIKDNTILNRIKINHNGLLRRNFLVIKEDPKIISIDHI